ncbi:hypothetical protein K461DRAFT_282472 [Myriangium duriaei CBS 260.36]|uniref:Uncharacterized protein n=1 Tax=Myriangium duriaei CBS 260.36 TaxID=1168546 RepID=A0A9P4MDB1_9PEZI|nr:hypothetical protein K461DRAFT_282472 [Myriangium duriaei CBS 260.36]
MNLLRRFSAPQRATELRLEENSAPAITTSDIDLPEVFPDEFNVYCTKQHINGKCDLFLGPHKDDCFLAVTSHNPLIRDSKIGTSIHGGKDLGYPIIATAGYNGSVTGKAKLSILSPPAPEPVEESLKMIYHWGSESYQFDLRVDDDGDLPSRFEWRASRGEEIKKVNKKAWGLKLMRLGQDGKEELVALLVTKPMANTKLGTFKFMGKSVGGGLGYIFSEMAILTGLRIWQVKWWAGQSF